MNEHPSTVLENTVPQEGFEEASAAHIATGFTKRILVAVSGLSPQVVTETLYALIVPSKEAAWIPTEVHLLTTTEGAERASLSLLSAHPGWFRRFCRDYAVTAIRFDASCIHVLKDAAGDALEDIRTEHENAAAGNAITEWIRHFTSFDDAAVHVSIAGGRKTMGFFAGYALSLFGREQDRLSHVLVSNPYESHPEFYYPTPKSTVLFTSPPNSRPIDAAKAAVTLARIPFVRMRSHLSGEALSQPLTFEDTVVAAQRRVVTASVLIDFAQGCLVTPLATVAVPPAELAFYAWFARRRCAGLPALPCPSDGAPDAALGREYLAEYQRAVGPWADGSRTASALRSGIDKNYFLEKKSRVNRILQTTLGPGAAAYQIGGIGRKPGMTYQLGLAASQITFREREEA